MPRKKKEESPDDILSVEEAATYFNVQPLTIREWCRLGKLRAVRPGRAWIIRRRDVYELAGLMYGEAGENNAEQASRVD